MKKTKSKKRRLPRPVTGWAWELHRSQWGRALSMPQLCYWAMPSRDMLIADGKPSPDAKPVRVRITKIAPRRRRSKLAILLDHAKRNERAKKRRKAKPKRRAKR